MVSLLEARERGNDGVYQMTLQRQIPRVLRTLFHWRHPLIYLILNEKRFFKG